MRVPTLCRCAVIALAALSAALRGGFLTLAPLPGFSINWDGNEGDYFTSADPANTVPGAPANVARLPGTIAFGSGEMGGNHFIAYVNDGIYGNERSWLDGANTPTYIGLAFDGLYALNAIAWGRDNGNDTWDLPSDPGGQQFTDRCLGTYVLQVTRVANPGTGTLVTENADDGWLSIGSVTYSADEGPFLPYLRHQYSIGTAGGDAILATGLRIVVSDSGTAIDEIELYAVPEPGSLCLLAMAGASALLARRRRR